VNVSAEEKIMYEVMKALNDSVKTFIKDIIPNI
jgi:hypothetical protein